MRRAQASANNLVLSVAYLLAAGLHRRVWGAGLLCGLSGWGEIAQLAYPACIMKCIEGWTFSGAILVAGLLPDATVAVAAISVSFSCYGLLYTPFVSFGMAVCTRRAPCAAPRGPFAMIHAAEWGA